MCGFTELQAQDLPDSGNSVVIDERSCDRLRQIAVQVASTLQEANVDIKQACYLPQSADGNPLIGRLGGLNNVYVAAVSIRTRPPFPQEDLLTWCSFSSSSRAIAVGEY